MSAPITPAGMPATGTPPALTDPPAASVAEAPPVAPVETPPAAPVAVAPPVAEIPPPAAPAADAVPTPPWGEDDANYDAPTAARLIANLRAQIKGKAPADPAPAVDAPPAAPEVPAAPVVDDAAAWRAHAVSAVAEKQAADKFGDAPAAMLLAGIGDGSAFVNGTAIDETKIAEALERVAEKHPLLLKQPPVQGFTPDRGQGQSGTGQIPIDERIKAAQASGDFATSIALKQQHFLNSQ